MGSNHYSSFDEYVKDFPEGETWREWFTNQPNAVLLKGSENWSCIPGHYYLAIAYPFYQAKEQRWMKGKVPSYPPHVTICDGDDYSLEKVFERHIDAIIELDILKELTPFDLCDLKDFGYNIK